MSTELDRWTDRLSEYLDGDLPVRERAALEQHLEGCAECREVLEDLRTLVARAAKLEDAEPPADLWPGIAHRIAERPVGRAGIAGWLGGSRRFAFSLPQLAAAAALLVVITGGGTWLALRGGTTSQGPLVSGPVVSNPVPSTSTPASEPGSSPGSHNGTEPRRGSSEPTLYTAEAQGAGYNLESYDATIGELQRVLTDNQANLDTTTVRIIEQNLAIIDRAIADARRALAADPASAYLNGHLAQQLQLKVRLLQKATGLVAEHQG